MNEFYLESWPQRSKSTYYSLNIGLFSMIKYQEIIKILTERGVWEQFFAQNTYSCQER